MSSTPGDWARAIIDAAEGRGWVVMALDIRASSLVLETPKGDITLRLQGRVIDAHFVEQLPDAERWIEDTAS